MALCAVARLPRSKAGSGGQCPPAALDPHLTSPILGKGQLAGRVVLDVQSGHRRGIGSSPGTGEAGRGCVPVPIALRGHGVGDALRRVAWSGCGWGRGASARSTHAGAWARAAAFPRAHRSAWARVWRRSASGGRDWLRLGTRSVRPEHPRGSVGASSGAFSSSCPSLCVGTALATLCVGWRNNGIYRRVVNAQVHTECVTSTERAINPTSPPSRPFHPRGGADCFVRRHVGPANCGRGASLWRAHAGAWVREKPQKGYSQ